ncbi:MAG: DsbA family protein [Miltoncostaeaceae bacterium]
MTLATVAAVAAGCGGGGDEAEAPEVGAVNAGPQNSGMGDRPEVDPSAAAEEAESGDTSFAHLDGIPQQGAQLGDPSAPVELVEFGDFLCTFCRRFSTETLPGLIDRHVREGTLRVVYNPVAFYGEDSERGALAAIAAGRQNRMWQFVEAVFAQQGSYPGEFLSEEHLRETADEVGLDMARWERDFTSDAVGDEFLAGLSNAQSAGVQGTPTFVLRGPGNAFLIPGAVPADQFDRAIEEVG